MSTHRQGMHLAVRAWLPVCVAALIAAGGEPWRLALRYERDALLAGAEWWRLLSAHLVHLNPAHLALDAASLVVIAVLFASVLTTLQWYSALLAGAAAIDVALLVLEPELSWYVGLSGVIHAVFVAGALATWRQRPGEGRLLLGLLGAKLAWEVLVGPMPWSETASRGPVVEEVHLYGTLGGALAWVAGRGGHRGRPAVGPD